MDELNTKQLKTFHDLLIKRRENLLAVENSANDAAKTVVLDQSSVGRLSRMDALQGQAMSVETNRRRDEELRNIATALARIESGDYGYCLECGEMISRLRLEVSPSTAYCIKCADL